MISALAPFLAGLGMFFSGIHFIAANLTPLAGRRFRALLGRMSKTSWMSALTGVAAGAISQSSNAVTSVTIALVSAHALDLRRAMLIPTWSHVGTAALVILVAIDFHVAASYLIAVAGAATYFGFTRNEKVGYTINLALGAGLLFFGIGLLKTGTGPLRDILIAHGVVEATTGSVWLNLLFGAVLTLLCQFSTVVGAIAVAATSVNIVDFDGACWMVYGANLASAVNQYVYANRFAGEQRQIALAQVVQKIAGFIGILMIVLAGALLDRPLIEDGAAALSDSPASRVAWVFLAYQVIGSLACSLARRPLSRWLIRVAPTSTLQEMSKPAFIQDAALVDASLAIELALEEEQRLVERVPTMLDGLRADAEGNREAPAVVHSASDAIRAAINSYLDYILDSGPDRADRERVLRLQHRLANLGALFDAVDEFRITAETARRWPARAGVAASMVEALHALLSALVEATRSDDAADRDFVLALLGHRDELMERMRRRVLRDNPDLPPAAQETLFSATMLFERIVWLARRGTLLLAPPTAAVRETP